MSLNLQPKQIEVSYRWDDEANHETIEEDLARIGYTVIHSSERVQSSGMYVVLAAQKDWSPE